ncbi:succinate dehydrogenase cytochrome b560 subunit [Sistotremastrum niveocremeum HHB9708]|uniref:Succinate dehydrogenase cytochrome b560 subunit n=1 Tax=Sistotremastrum niveocremeum HHB9708 TaxID=1314777 RepID=A0A164TVX1_9AGAM|nr:succinate dehydrogenase cytochrome b560 subunit [Sistotremastrum niveocremeum HHB9708]
MSYRAVGLGSTLRRNILASRNASVTGRVLVRTLAPRRLIQTESVTESASRDILNAQRLKRPSSPHFTIYQPQLTWIGSIANRITGSALSVLLYGFSLAYLISPAFGMPFDSAAVISLVHDLPGWVKLTGKALLAAPFTFHSFNGLRHLAWDSGKFLTLKGAYSSGYAVLGATAVSTIALILI